MITKKGLGLGTGALVLAVAALATGSQAALAVAVLAGAMLIVGRLSRHEVQLAVTRRIAPERIFEAERVRAEVIIRNAGESAGFLEVQDELSERLEVHGEARGLFALRAGETASLDYELSCPVKGVYATGPLRYRLEDVFGLYAETRAHADEAYFTVYPRSEDVEVQTRSRLPRGFLGEHIVRSPGQGMEFFGLREYTRSDPLREVNWKASARAGELIVNQRERESITDVAVFYDFREASGIGTASRNANVLSARAAASLLDLLLARRDRLKFVAYGQGIRILQPETGERQRYKILQELASLEPSGHTSLAEAVDEVLPTLNPKSPVVVLSNLEEDPRALEAITRLAARELNVLVLSPSPLVEGMEIDPTLAELMRLEREAMLSLVRATGARVLDWTPETRLTVALLQGEIA